MKFFRQLKASVTDFRFYNLVRNNTFGKSFAYFLILFLILYSINAVENYAVVNNIMNAVAIEINEQVPNFNLENGKFSFEGDMPFYVFNETDVMFVVDTTGQISPDDLKDADSSVLVTENEVYFRNELRNARYDFEDYKELTLTKQGLLDFLPRVPKFALIVVALGFIFVLGYKLLNVVILALVGLILCALLKSKLKFNNLMNYAIYALSLPMLLQTALDLAGYPVPSFWIIYWAVSILYMGLAIKYTYDDANIDNANILIAEKASDEADSNNNDTIN